MKRTEKVILAGVGVGVAIIVIVVVVLSVTLDDGDDEPPIVFEPKSGESLDTMMAWHECPPGTTGIWDCNNKTELQTFASSNFWDSSKTTTHGKLPAAFLGTDQALQGVKYAKMLTASGNNSLSVKWVCIEGDVGGEHYKVQIKFNKVVNGKITWRFEKDGAEPIEVGPGDALEGNYADQVPAFLQGFATGSLRQGKCSKDKAQGTRLEFQGREQN